LQDPQGHEEDRSRDTDLLRGRHQADENGRGAHHDKCGDEGLLAAEAVAEVPEEDRPERSGDERDPERREGGDRAGRGAQCREEGLTEHERCRGAVDQEVVVFDHRAGNARDRNASHRGRCRNTVVGRHLGSLPAEPTRAFARHSWDSLVAPAGANVSALALMNAAVIRPAAIVLRP
jgi:hypothetical protein